MQLYKKYKKLIIEATNETKFFSEKADDEWFHFFRRNKKLGNTAKKELADIKKLWGLKKVWVAEVEQGPERYRYAAFKNKKTGYIDSKEV